MTQRQRVLETLKAAGSKGVRSDAFIADFMPRAAARVQELKDEGYAISSEREGKYVRWTLTNVGVDAGSGRSEAPGASIHSGVADSVTPLPEAPPGTSMYDPFEEWAA